MHISAFGDVIGRRFRIAPAPTLVTKLSTSDPVTFMRLHRNDRHHVSTVSAAAESAFAVQIQLRKLDGAGISYRGVPVDISKAQAGSVFLLDMERRVGMSLRSAFDIVRFYVSRGSLRQIAEENDLRWNGNLEQPAMGDCDPVLHHLGSSLIPTFDRGGGGSMLVDHTALAFAAHLIATFGGGVATSNARGGLAHWQMRRVVDLIESSLDRDIALIELATVCALSPSHFARAFRRAVGVTPHRYLQDRRIKRAMNLLRSMQSPIVEIATTCGFADQSHFNRVFKQHVGTSPGAWRRYHGRSP